MSKDKNKTKDIDQVDDTNIDDTTDDTTQDEVEEEVLEIEEEDLSDEEVSEEDVEETEEKEEESEEKEDDEDEDEEDKEDTKEKTKTSKSKKEALMVINDDVSDDAKWYVVHTYSGHERKVAELINARVLGRAFQNKVFKILVPTQEKIVVSDGKKRRIDEKLFPGYIIVNMIMGDDAWYLVRSTKGVTGFVGTGNNPTPLPQSEVDALMKFMTMEAPKFEAKFREGDSVKITGGPFQDFLGKVDEVNEDQGKVRVLVSVFGRETPVELDFTQISSI